MPYLLLLCSFLFFNSTLAGPQSSNHALYTRSSGIPRCARPCIEDFISTSFSASSCRSSDLTCLCTSDSASGFTLGEGALRCLVSDCTDITATDYETAYALCSTTPDAKPETHRIISAAMADPTTIIVNGGSLSGTLMTATTLRYSTTGIITDSAFPSPATVSRAGNTESRSTSMPTFPSSVPSTSTFLTAAATSSASPAARPILNTAQIVGVSVAGGAIFLIASGLLIFLFCARRKSGSKRDSDASFGGDKIIGEVPDMHDNVADFFKSAGNMPPRPVAPKAQQFLGVPARPLEQRSVTSNRTPKPQDIGVALSPDLRGDFIQDLSPNSVASYRSTSRLLPDKPCYKATRLPKGGSSLQPGHPAEFADGVGLRIIAQTPPPASHGFPERRPVPTTRQHPMQNYPSIYRQPSDPFITPSGDPSSTMHTMKGRRASRKDLPPLLTHGNHYAASGSQDMPDLASVQQPPRTFSTMGNPPMYRLPVSSADQRSSQPFPRSRQQMEPPPLFSNNAPLTDRRPRFPTNYHENNQPPFSKYAPLKQRRNSGKRPLTYLTMGSDTSFEDDCEVDEPVSQRPELASHLSPVAESPRGKTPLSLLQYPTIPGRGASAKQLRIAPESPTRQSSRTVQRPILISVRPHVAKMPPPHQGPASTQNGPFELPERSLSRPVTPEQQKPLQRSPNDDIKGSAKWQILCSPDIGTTDNQYSPSWSVPRLPSRAPT